ncbi:hypothetical protein [Phenylobacterium sp.]|uniref:hypothetical protein n=1 Tax=Phenylobacterium sp. TaxID=1871053 RepID=UPI002ED8DE1A
MQQSIAFADEDVRRAVRALSADVQAALALSRATLQAIATLTPSLGAAAETAIDQELERAQELGAQRSVEVLTDVQARLQEIPEQAKMVSALEHALLAAADALPDFHEIDEPAARTQ